MLTEICQYLHNWFEKSKHIGTVTIEGNAVSVDGKPIAFLDGMYFRIVGSLLNDGVHQFPATLKDETFAGAVWMMGIPADFLALVADIGTWVEKYGDVANSPFSSESFGGYSYSKGGTAGSDGATWQSVFKARLNAWRKL